MNKAQLIEAVALEAGISKMAAKRAVDAVIDTTIQALREGDKLSLSGLGTFSVAVRPARTGRNPRTGAAVPIPPKRVVKFRPSLELE